MFIWHFVSVIVLFDSVRGHAAHLVLIVLQRTLVDNVLMH